MKTISMPEWVVSIESFEQRGSWLEDSFAYEMLHSIQVTNQRGRRFGHFHVFKTEAEAGVTVLAIERAIGAGRFSPVGSPYWVECQPVYGSEEYSATGGDLEHHIDLEPEMNPMLSESEKHRVASERDFYAAADYRRYGGR